VLCFVMAFWLFPYVLFSEEEKVLTDKIVDDKTVDKSTNILRLTMSEKQTPIKEPLGPMLTRTSRTVGSMLQQMFVDSGHDLSADEWSVLANLKMLQDGQFQQQLADRTFKDKAAITRLIDGLEKKELVKREAGQKDRRQKKIYLTPKSSQLMEKLFPVAMKAQQKVQQGIKIEDLETFKTVLRQIFTNASQAE
jgi:DNA-binding MarR family transcriptional regulator